MYQESFYPACAAGQIHALRWEPSGEAKAVVQIVHGVSEYAARYDEFATLLQSHGILVVAQDHMGHGCSVSPECGKGDFAGNWFQAVADVHELFCQTRSQNRGIPYILLGHSMGSFMVRTILARYPETALDAVILMGTGWMGNGLIRFGDLATRAWGTLFGRHKPSKRMTGLMFHAYNQRIDQHRSDFDWLTRESEVLDRYLQDPLCAFPVTPALANAMMQGLRYIQDPVQLQKMPKKLPILFVSGDADPVGNYGEGVHQAAQAFRQVGMERVEVKLYPECRHEILHEINRQQVQQELMQWLQQQIAGESGGSYA